jgi:hypothetical protein
MNDKTLNFEPLSQTKNNGNYSVESTKYFGFFKRLSMSDALCRVNVTSMWGGGSGSTTIDRNIYRMHRRKLFALLIF